jgi:selT/selW/selH-like putative selenoprotein
VLHAQGQGIFDVSLDGKLIFSKYETGRFPEPGEVANLIPDELSKRL